MHDDSTVHNLMVISQRKNFIAPFLQVFFDVLFAVVKFVHLRPNLLHDDSTDARTRANRLQMFSTILLRIVFSKSVPIRFKGLPV